MAAWAKPSPRLTEEAALPCSLAVGSRQSETQLPNRQPGHQSFGQGSELYRMSPDWPLPRGQPAGAPPTCQGHCLPGPHCALIGRSLCARLGGRCWAPLGPRSVRGDPGPGQQSSRPGCRVRPACAAGALVVFKEQRPEHKAAQQAWGSTETCGPREGRLRAGHGLASGHTGGQVRGPDSGFSWPHSSFSPLPHGLLLVDLTCPVWH